MACGQNLDSKEVRGRWRRLQGMACCLRLFAFRSELAADWVYCAPDGVNCRQGWGIFFAGLRVGWGWRGGAGLMGGGGWSWRLRSGGLKGWLPGGFWVCIGFR